MTKTNSKLAKRKPRKPSANGVAAPRIPGQWNIPIVGLKYVDPEQLTANPRNFRTHPMAQREALSAAIDKIGFIVPPIENIRTGYLIDGHERAWQAQQSGQKKIPVIQIDVAPEDEPFALATLDLIGALAVADKDKLDSLLREVSTDSEALDNMLAELVSEASPAPSGGAGDRPEQQPIISFNLVFDDEQQQVWFDFMRALKDRFQDAETLAARLVAFIQESGLAADGQV